VVSRPGIAGFGVAYPPTIGQDELWDGFFERHYAGPIGAFARRIFGNSGVHSRHTVISPLQEDASSWSTGQRMARYLVEAMPLGKDATEAALAEAGVPASEVGLFVVCSCTGYATPGLDILLARDLGLPASSQRVFIGHMGCYACLPGLRVASDFVVVQGKPALLLCLELPSLHVQPPTRDPQQVVAHALFSDAAAAVVVVPSRDEYAVRAVESVTDTTTADLMTWNITDLGFRMGLSAHVPEVLARHVPSFVQRLLDSAGRRLSDVEDWAIHPGGPRILDVVQSELGLSTSDLAASRGVLAEHGNCSSPTALMILERLRRARTSAGRPQAGTSVALAFGPGLTLYGAVLG
jgi:predicted naringenin-chalcone synthase